MTRSPIPSWRALTLALLAVLLVASGCGLSEDGGPRAIATEDLPADLLEVGESTTTTVAGVTTPVTVYLIRREGDETRLQGVEREVSDASLPGARIDALLQPVTKEEQALGLTSSVPTDTAVLGAERTGATQELVIDLSEAFLAVEGRELALAFAQIVYTVTELEGVRRVRFRFDGEPRRALDAEGIEQDGAVTAADYLAFAPR